MDFVRRRFFQGGSSDEEGRLLFLSFFEGILRFFILMVVKKNGFINNFFNKLENVMKFALSFEDLDFESVSFVQIFSFNYSSYSNGSRNYRGEDFLIQLYRFKKKTERIGILRRYSFFGYLDSSGNDEIIIGNISFDELLYSFIFKFIFFYDLKQEILLKINCIRIEKVNNIDRV